MTDVITWSMVQKTPYDAARLAEFAACADCKLIAHALATGDTVVTHEKCGGNLRSKVKIPDVCRGLSVPCVDTFKVLEELKVRFVLATS